MCTFARRLSCGLLASLALLAACGELDPPTSAPAEPPSRFGQQASARPAPAPAALVRPAEDPLPGLAVALATEEEPPAAPVEVPAPVSKVSPSAVAPQDSTPHSRRAGQRGGGRPDASAGGMNRVPLERDRDAPPKGPGGGGAPVGGLGTASGAGGAPELPQQPAQDGRGDAARRRDRRP